MLQPYNLREYDMCLSTSPLRIGTWDQIFRYSVFLTPGGARPILMRWEIIFLISFVSWMTAIIFIFPPHWAWSRSLKFVVHSAAPEHTKLTNLRFAFLTNETFLPESAECLASTYSLFGSISSFHSARPGSLKVQRLMRASRSSRNAPSCTCCLNSCSSRRSAGNYSSSPCPRLTAKTVFLLHLWGVNASCRMFSLLESAKGNGRMLLDLMLLSVSLS